MFRRTPYSKHLLILQRCGSVRIHIIFQDPDTFPGILGSGFRFVSYSLRSKTKLSGRENLTKYAFFLGPVGPTDKENQVKMIKSTVLGTTVRIRTNQLKSRIRIHIKRVWIRKTAILLFLGRQIMLTLVYNFTLPLSNTHRLTRIGNKPEDTSP